MSRLQRPGKISLPLDVDLSRIEYSQQPGFRYSLFAPLHYEKNYAYPLLVWLHSPGGDERQLQRIMPLISMRNYVGVAPRAVLSSLDANRHAAALAPSHSAEWCQTAQGIETAERLVEDSIQAATDRFHVAPSRVFLAGYASGGTMALRIGLRSPDRYAGALSIGGAFPSGEAPLRNLNLVRSLPLFIATGRESPTYSLSQLCDEVRLFHSAGMTVTIRQYPCGDELNTAMLHDMDVWMMELITGVRDTRDDEQETADPFWRAN